MLFFFFFQAFSNFRKAKNILLKSNQITNLKYVRCASKNKLCQENKPLEQKPWTPIYFFPFIRITAVFSRFKLYQTVFTVAAIPLSVSFYNSGLMEASSVGVVSGCAIFACTTLYLLSYYFRRLIGVMLLSEDEESVEISHLTFWGRKNDIVVSVQDIVPLAESGCNPSDIYIKLKRFSCDDKLYFTIKFGKILDKEKFEKVFGVLEIPQTR